MPACLGRYVAAILAALLLAGAIQESSRAAQPALQDGLTQIADDVFVFRMTEYNALFIVSDAGVLVVDPIGPTRSEALKAAIASVTSQPVRYVVYCHDHADHISGGDVFADTAEFVSQANALPRILARGDPRTPAPTIVFDEQLALDLGGKTIELHYVGPGHSDNNLLLMYPARRIAYGADFIEARSVFSGQLSPWINNWVDSFIWIEHSFDIDILVAGHGPLGSRDTFREARQYFLDLVEAVRAARRASLADGSPEMVAHVRTALAPTYGSWTRFEERIGANVMGIIRYWQGL